MDKRMFKKTGEELQEYLRIMCKHHVVPSKKGKGSCELLITKVISFSFE